jgi:NDP-sugar pyrophosphorylase family protein
MGGNLSLCFFLTAGLGTRLKPFTETLPKPCLPILNLPLLNYGIYLAKMSGFNDFLFNKHHLPDALEKQIQSLNTFANSIKTSDETNKILGSGGALWNAKKELSKHDFFLVANGDEILVPTKEDVLSKLVEKFKKDNALATLLTCDHPDLLKSLKPVWVNKDGFVQGFGMSPVNKESHPVHYTGYKVFSKRIFDYIPEGESNIFHDVVTAALAKGERISSLHLLDSSWYETGNFDSFLDASIELSEKHWEYILKVNKYFNQNIKKSTTPTQSKLIHFLDQLIPQNIDFQGFNTVGKNISFGKNLRLKDSILCNHAVIKDNTSINRSFVF